MGTLASTDPRVPGGVYLSGYWRRTYTVLAMWTPADADILWFAVRWADRPADDLAGRVTVHCTPWDGKRDEIVSMP